MFNNNYDVLIIPIGLNTRMVLYYPKNFSTVELFLKIVRFFLREFLKESILILFREKAMIFGSSLEQTLGFKLYWEKATLGR